MKYDDITELAKLAAKLNKEEIKTLYCNLLNYTKILMIN